ncbi:hypothetical protein M3Y97_00452100 [Aphelenchoides bicaudatus]|nr:hypothetical protein M3Y97_00452100 [Aphelenchoides bicaudatus]
MNTSSKPVLLRRKRLHSRARHLAYRYMSSTIYSRKKFMEPCAIPFINRNYIEHLWSSPSILLVLDSGKLVNLFVPEDYNCDSIAQGGLDLNLAIGMLKLGKPSIIQLKVNVMCRLSITQFVQLARFLKETSWIKEIQLTVPSIPNPSLQMLVDLIAPKVTYYCGPNFYIPFVKNQANLHTLMNTQEVRPYDWLTKRPSHHYPDYSILNAFQTKAKKLCFEFVGLFEQTWKNAPLPENKHVQSIQFIDAGLMNKMTNAQSSRLCSESVENCVKTIHVLEQAINPECQVIFNHRSWSGFPRLQSIDLLINELILLTERARHLSFLAKSNGLQNFACVIEMDIVLKRSQSFPTAFQPKHVLERLETHFPCKFEIKSAGKGNEKPPQCFTASLDGNSVTVSIDFNYALQLF